MMFLVAKTMSGLTPSQLLVESIHLTRCFICSIESIMRLNYLKRRVKSMLWLLSNDMLKFWRRDNSPPLRFHEKEEERFEGILVQQEFTLDKFLHLSYVKYCWTTYFFKLSNVNLRWTSILSNKNLRWTKK